MKKALVPALLLVLGSVLLGATVLREPLAWAAPPMPSVFVANDESSPVPAREQNLDADGNIKVHEQGTADVNVTNTSLPVAPPPPVTRGGGSLFVSSCPDERFPGTVIASALRINWSSTITGVNLLRGTFVAASFVGPSGGDESAVDLSLTRPITFDRIQCFGAGGASVSWVGNEP
jgi:hypothetical protein